MTFPGFLYIKQVEVDQLLEKVPARFDKKTEFMSEQSSKDAKLLCLNSANNEKAD